MLRPFAHPVACCCVMLGVVAQSLKPVKMLSQQLPTCILFSDRRSVAQQFWIPFAQLLQHVEATHAHVGPSIVRVTASVCTPTRTHQLPTLLAQRCVRFQVALGFY